ncbi:MAG: alanine--glyoxylate aminotransferase family protein [Halobacteria archaeon]
MSDRSTVGELQPPDRLLMGPGPSNVHPRVLRAMSASVVGHLDPYFLEVMDDVQELLRYVFQTDNEWTIPVSGTGSAAMEACFTNLVEPGDTVLVPTNGYFGERMESMARRVGGDTRLVEADWGKPLDVEVVKEAFEEHDPDVFGVVHAETSTGVLQPHVDELVDIAHDNDAYVVLDTVTSLAGVEVDIDGWGVDAAYSADQKCLSCPPGASPLTLSPRAMDKINSRDTEPKSWYLDLSLLDEYWGSDRSYHHTAPISNVYALREALRIVEEEGLEERWRRHREVAGALKTGVEAMGLEMNAEDEYWLPPLNAVRIPEEVDAAAVLENMMEEYGIEISSGLGDLEGKILRIGCMGHSAQIENVLYVVGALGKTLEGMDVDVNVEKAMKALS